MLSVAFPVLLPATVILNIVSIKSLEMILLVTLALNILEAALTDFKGGSKFNALTGLVLIALIPSCIHFSWTESY